MNTNTPSLRLAGILSETTAPGRSTDSPENNRRYCPGQDGKGTHHWCQLVGLLGVGLGLFVMAGCSGPVGSGSSSNAGQLIWAMYGPGSDDPNAPRLQQQYDYVLSRFVGRDGGVDYRHIETDPDARDVIEQFLAFSVESLRTALPDSPEASTAMSTDPNTRAHAINAANAMALLATLRACPEWDSDKPLSSTFPRECALVISHAAAPANPASASSPDELAPPKQPPIAPTVRLINREQAVQAEKQPDCKIVTGNQLTELAGSKIDWRVRFALYDPRLSGPGLACRRFRGDRLGRQLDNAVRDYAGSCAGLQINHARREILVGELLWQSPIFQSPDSAGPPSDLLDSARQHSQSWQDRRTATVTESADRSDPRSQRAALIQWSWPETQALMANVPSYPLKRLDRDDRLHTANPSFQQLKQQARRERFRPVDSITICGCRPSVRPGQ